MMAVMRIVAGTLLIIGLVALLMLFVWTQAHFGRIGREARAANGGRHTQTWWASPGIAVVLIVVLVVTTH